MHQGKVMKIEEEVGSPYQTPRLCEKAFAIAEVAIYNFLFRQHEWIKTRFGTNKWDSTLTII